MTDFPDVKLKALVTFPATVLDGTGIDIVKANGSYQFNLAYDDFVPPVSSVADPTHQNALLWNDITKQYALTPISLFGVTPAALTRTNDTNVTLTLGGTPTTALLQATSLTAGWSGTLSAARGGFGADVSAANGVPLFATGTATFTSTTGTGNFVRAADPVFTGNPTAPTPTAGDNDTSIATTAFVQTVASSLVKTVKVQKFTASGTYTPSAGMLYCIAECLGGGGGGGGATGTVGTFGSGGGGGGGSYSRAVLTAAAIGASKAITIGAAGSGSTTTGGTGGDTSLGVLCVAKGGTGGTTGPLGVGGGGGVAGTGDVTGTGANGFMAINGNSPAAVNAINASGGTSWLGGPGQGSVINGGTLAGQAAVGFGGGGNGGATHNVAVAVSGGSGTAGIVIVTEFCSQ